MDELLSLFVWIVGVLIALQFFGGFISVFLARQKRELLPIDSEFMDPPPPPPPGAKIERYQDVFYVFDANTDVFIGQGSTRKEFKDRKIDINDLGELKGNYDDIREFKKLFY